MASPPLDPKASTLAGAGQPNAGPPVELLGGHIPTKLARYLVLDALPSGPRGPLLLGYDEGLARQVALKVQRGAGVNETDNAMRAAQALARLKHPNALNVFDVSMHESSVVVVMELVKGESLARWLAKGGRTWRQVLSLFDGLGRAVSAASELGLAPGRLRLEDIIVRPSGQACLLDPIWCEVAEPAQVGARRHCQALQEALNQLAGVPSWLSKAAAQGAEGTYTSWPQLRAALEDKGPRRTRWGLSVVLTCGIASLTWWATARPPPCRGAEAHLQGVWDEAQGKALRAGFLATGNPLAEDIYQRTRAVLDAYVQNWVSMRTEACEATRVHHTQPDSDLSLRTECLDRHLSRLKALTNVLARPSTEILLKSIEAANGLPSLQACADIEALHAPARPPDDPRVRAQLRKLSDRLAQAQALRSAGQVPQALEVASALVPEADSLAYAPFQAELLLTLGQLKSSATPVTAEPTLRQAARLAWSATTKTRFEAALALFILHESANDVAAATHWDHLVGALLERLGSPPLQASALALARNKWKVVQGDYPASMEYARQALEFAAIAEAGQDARVARGLAARAHTEMGGALSLLGRYDESLVELRKGLALRETAFGAEHPEVGDSRAMLGDVYHTSGHYDLALKEYQAARAILEKGLGPQHPKVLNVRDSMGALWGELGRYDEALEELRKVLALRELVLGPHHSGVGFSRNNIGTVLLDMGRNAEALAEFRRALGIWEASQGPEHPLVAWCIANIGATYTAMGRYDLALVENRKALAIGERVLGPDSFETAYSRLNLGVMYAKLGRLPEALAEHLKALSIWEKTLGPENAVVAQGLSSLADVYFRMGRYAQALATDQRALPILEKIQDKEVEQSLERMGAAYERLGRAREAATYRRRLEDYRAKKAERQRARGHKQ